jgi:hypothetical protein
MMDRGGGVCPLLLPTKPELIPFSVDREYLAIADKCYGTAESCVSLVNLKMRLEIEKHNTKRT